MEGVSPLRVLENEHAFARVRTRATILVEKAVGCCVHDVMSS